jgi:hypothetical protein
VVDGFGEECLGHGMRFCITYRSTRFPIFPFNSVMSSAAFVVTLPQLMSKGRSSSFLMRQSMLHCLAVMSDIQASAATGLQETFGGGGKVTEVPIMRRWPVARPSTAPTLAAGASSGR